jgi:hypothetical protein
MRRKLIKPSSSRIRTRESEILVVKFVNCAVVHILSVARPHCQIYERAMRACLLVLNARKTDRYRRENEKPVGAWIHPMMLSSPRNRLNESYVNVKEHPIFPISNPILLQPPLL